MTDTVPTVSETLTSLEAVIGDQTCDTHDPFIKLGTGAAPTLNYNIPQTTCFSTYGHIMKNIPDEYFTDLAHKIPPDNYFNRIDNLSADAINAALDPGLKVTAAPGKGVYYDPNLPNFQFAGNANDPRAGNQLSYAPNTPQYHLQAQAAQAATFNPQYNAAFAPAPLLVFNNNTGVAGSATPKAPLKGIADSAKLGYRPVLVRSFGPDRTSVGLIPRPKTVKPYFAIIEEYRTCSYLGDYGAGRTVKTFSLLPGEKTTISVRTYKDMETTSEYAKNVIDSYSNSSADSFERMLSEEQGQLEASKDSWDVNGQQSGNKGFSWNHSSSHSDNMQFGTGFSSGVSASVLDIVGVHMDNSFGIGMANQNATEDQFSLYNNQAYSTSVDISHTGMRQSNIDTLSRALDRHVNESNSNRQIDVNTSTTSRARETEEESTVREIVNYNKSRTLNFVWRQLLQEYLTVTYLANVRFLFCNGYPETVRIIDLGNLDNALRDLIVPDKIAEVKKYLLKHYCKVMNYNDDLIDFIEQVTVDFSGCFPGSGGSATETETFWRIKKGLVDTYTSGGLEISVKGVILNVAKQTLRTSSMVVDALLGQGEALDCYNSKLQDADAIRAYLDNMVTMQQLNAIDGLTDPEQKATLYKKVFGTCCDGPQVEIVH
ncbi:MAG: hypothetical protein JSS82_08865 [Bacteroidetes bacterium]|nr:hypothetical protein [Bacteroidota bacterium]